MSSPFNGPWNFIGYAEHSGEFNMQFDMQLVEQFLRGEIPPTVRLYGWKPWAVSLGYHQSVRDIDEQKCSEYGIDVVRRPTGGRAVLHADELTYSVVMNGDGIGITEMYSLISKALVNGLSSIVPRISYETVQPDFTTLYRKQESVLCFSSSARYEVQIDGKKLVGSAQRRFSSPNGVNAILQHGSILLGAGHKLLPEMLRLNGTEAKSSVVTVIEEKTIDLSGAAGRTVTREEASEAVKNGFMNALNVRFAQTIQESV